MEFDDVVQGRRSIRGFKPDPVPKEVIHEVVALATRAPSSMNTQPWHLHVVSGEPLDRIRAGNTERNLAGVPASREIRMHGPYAGVHRERQKAIAGQLFEAMDIEWSDKERRQDWVLRGFRQFDAPVSIVVTFDAELTDNDIAIFDCGAVVNCLVNAAWSRGLGCVINGQGIMQSPVVREHARIPDNEVIMSCVAMGWPADNFPANDVVSTRRPVDEVITFVGFED
ncbi:MAG: nitroreductase [Gammaproteobacteria bacterium]|nr:MAG: nitroreductase [Gammaproteobacteria bacterium]